MKQKVLIVEDEPDVIDLVKYNLMQAGFEVETAMDGEEGLQKAKKDAPNLILLDLMLPQIDGLEVCKLLRRDSKTSGIPIIMLTAKAAEIDRVLGLELGADDYITKPFSPRELVLRIKKLLHRTRLPDPQMEAYRATCKTPQNRRDEFQEFQKSLTFRAFWKIWDSWNSSLREFCKWLYHFGDMSVDLPRHLVTVKGRRVDLTATEFKLLVTLIQRRGHVQSREALLRDVWEYEKDIDTRTVDTHMRRLREKLGTNSARFLDTIRGVGYRFVEL